MRMENMMYLFGCLITLVILNNVSSMKKIRNKKYFNLEEMEGSKKFENKKFNGSWISGTEFIYFKNNEGGIFLYNLKNQRSTLFLPEDTVEKLESRELFVSPDRKFILVRSDKFKDHLQVFSWRFALYDIDNGNLTQLADNRHIRQCLFLRDHSVIYNIDNNLFYIEDISTNPEPLALTTDGVPGSVYNGVPDYIYGDVFYRQRSLTWISKNGNWVAIGFFNDSIIADATFFTYGLPNNSIDHQYSTVRHVRYPEPGKTHPIVSIKILNLKDAANPKWVVLNKAPEEFFGKDQLYTSVTWASEDELAVTWMNRPQNKSALVICNLSTTKCKSEVFRQQVDGWIESTIPIFSRTNRKVFLDTVSFLQNDTSKGEFIHVAKYTRGKKYPEPMTSGLRTVIAINGWNEEADLIYYTSTLEETPWNIHLFVAGSRNECVSCDMKSPYGEYCNYTKTTFSPGDQYFAVTCNSRAPSYTVIYNAQTAKPVIMWQDNAISRKFIDEYHLPQTKYIRVHLQDSDVFFKISFPPQFDPDDTSVKYPLIVHIYAGPSTAKVTTIQELDHEEFWATNRSYIYARIEGRGSAYKGTRTLYANYRKFGTVEIDDVINGTRYLLDTYPAIDKKHVGIWGWSYGGYACLQGLARDYYNIYKCGVSVAPLIDLRQFLSMRMEAYLGMPTPDDNLEGYENANFLNHALKLRGKMFAVLVGNADENAHYGKSLQFFRKLMRAGIDFEQMSYPEEAHLLLGVLPHVYHFIDDFWHRCFNS